MTPLTPDEDKTELNENQHWEMELYKQGSEACRNYSQLTMRTRTLSQQILAVSVVGLGAAIANKDISIGSQIFLTGGVVLLVFSGSLFFVDWHYQSAFTAIRNSLAFIESRQPLFGPWIAHLNVRTHFRDHIASYLPFLLLAIVGCLGIWLGINQGGASVLRIGGAAWPIPMFETTSRWITSGIFPRLNPSRRP